MDGAFDPYYKWLAIPSEAQPPDHYRLLGIPLFTADADVIENLAEQRIRHIRSFQIGERSNEASQLLNEIAAARFCLLDPNLKATYDAQLRRQLNAPSGAPVAVPAQGDNPVSTQESLASQVAVSSPPVVELSNDRIPHSQRWLRTAIPLTLGFLAFSGLVYAASNWITRKDDRSTTENTNPFHVIEETVSTGPVSKSNVPIEREFIPRSFPTAPPSSDPASAAASRFKVNRRPRIDSSLLTESKLDRNNVTPAQPSTPTDTNSTPESIAPMPPTDAWSFEIPTGEGRGADAMVQIGVSQRFGTSPILGVRTRNGLETNHTYLRFDLHRVGPSERVDVEVQLVLSMIGVPPNIDGVVYVIGVGEVDWSENLLQWNNSYSATGLQSFPILARVPLAENITPGIAVSQLQISSRKLTEFVVGAGDRVSLVLAGAIENDTLLRFASREQSMQWAPKLTFSHSDEDTKQTDSIHNSLGMRLVRVPEGKFQMGATDIKAGSGSAARPGTAARPGRVTGPGSVTGIAGRTGTDIDAEPDTVPVHQVTISQSFYLSETEVTQSQWEHVMKTSPWENQPYTKSGPDYPATFVSWSDASSFCVRLSSTERKRYRLPTEAEWEYACRANQQTTFSYGDSESDLDEYAWYDRNAYSENLAHPHRVGLKRPNPFGLFDMHGNVWEWCSDWYDERYYRRTLSRDPKGPGSGELRVLRGGGWGSEAMYCRSALRDKFESDHRSPDVGFRVVLVSP